MNDELLDRLVRDADPYRPGTVERPDSALLEEIVNPVRRPVFRRLATAAAVLIGALIALNLTADSAERTIFPASMVEVAEANPRLLIDDPGWAATHVHGFAEKDGSIGFTNGSRSVEMTWFDADFYPGYRTDRARISAPEEVTVDGWKGHLYRYAATDFAVLLTPRDGVAVELRSGGMDRQVLDGTLDRVVRVDVRRWLEALPDTVVTPEDADEAAAEILAGVPLPPGLDPAALDIGGANDPYQFGAAVTSRVGCGWIEEFTRARKAGDGPAAEAAVAALGTSRDWKVLRDMADDGGWSEVFWEYADEVAAGKVPDGYRSGLGC